MTYSPFFTTKSHLQIMFLKNHEELRGLILFLHSNFIFGRKGLPLARHIYNISLVKNEKDLSFNCLPMYSNNWFQSNHHINL
jgi:hypothetical protein